MDRLLRRWRVSRRLIGGLLQSFEDFTGDFPLSRDNVSVLLSLIAYSYLIIVHIPQAKGDIHDHAMLPLSPDYVICQTSSCLLWLLGSIIALNTWLETCIEAVTSPGRFINEAISEQRPTTVTETRTYVLVNLITLCVQVLSACEASTLEEVVLIDRGSVGAISFPTPELGAPRRTARTAIWECPYRISMESPGGGETSPANHPPRNLLELALSVATYLDVMCRIQSADAACSWILSFVLVP